MGTLETTWIAEIWAPMAFATSSPAPTVVWPKGLALIAARILRMRPLGRRATSTEEAMWRTTERTREPRRRRSRPFRPAGGKMVNW
jgi:hypothetical protein